MKKALFSLIVGLFLLLNTETGFSARRFSFILVRNYTSSYIKVYINGKLRGFVRAKKSRKFNVKPGRVNVKITDPRNNSFTKTFRILPGRTQTWNFKYPQNMMKKLKKMIKMFKPKMGTLLITNSNAFPIRVIIDGKNKGYVRAYDSKEFKVNPKRITVRVTSANGNRVRSFRISPGDYEEWEVFIREKKRTGIIEVQNSSSVPIDVIINNNYRGSLSPGMNNNYVVASGSVEVTLSYGDIEKTRTFNIAGGEKTRWRVGREDFGPRSPEIKITSSFPERVQIIINGRTSGHLYQDESRNFTLENGNNKIELQGQDVSVELTVNARPGQKIIWNPQLRVE